MVQTWIGFIKTDDQGFMSWSSQSNRTWAVWTPRGSRPLPTVLPGLQGSLAARVGSPGMEQALPTPAPTLLTQQQAPHTFLQFCVM